MSQNERVLNALRSHKRRAKRVGRKVGYSYEQLDGMVRHTPRCEYCNDDLDERTWTCDHELPVCRGGSFELENICICCRRCNEVKGALTRPEFEELLKLTMSWSRRAREEVHDRLRRGSFRRRR